MKHALLRTLPGRAIVIGAGVKLIVFALTAFAQPPGWVRLVDTIASVALVGGGAYLLARGLSLAQRHLLWRVRRKLIISYIFIGFVPAILIVAFFLLGGLLLFSNFSSYLLRPGCSHSRRGRRQSPRRRPSRSSAPAAADWRPLSRAGRRR
jgi:hypothetical protein